MSDLISREEVLNLIDTAFESGAFDGRYAYENLIDAVQNLIHPLETDLVSRQAITDTIETDCSWDMFDEWGNRTPIGECIIEAIKRVPSVEPERKPGHWEWDKRAGEYECSECGCNPIYEGTTPDVSEIDKYKFCRWCGAKMAVEIVNKHMRRE